MCEQVTAPGPAPAKKASPPGWRGCERRLDGTRSGGGYRPGRRGDRSRHGGPPQSAGGATRAPLRRGDRGGRGGAPIPQRMRAATAARPLPPQRPRPYGDSGAGRHPREAGGGMQGPANRRPGAPASVAVGPGDPAGRGKFRRREDPARELGHGRSGPGGRGPGAGGQGNAGAREDRPGRATATPGGVGPRPGITTRTLGQRLAPDVARSSEKRAPGRLECWLNTLRWTRWRAACLTVAFAGRPGERLFAPAA